MTLLLLLLLAGAGGFVVAGPVGAIIGAGLVLTGTALGSLSSPPPPDTTPFITWEKLK